MCNNSKIFLFGKADKDGIKLDRWESKEEYEARIIGLKPNTIGSSLVHALYFHEYTNKQKDQVISLLKYGFNISLKPTKDYWGIDFWWIEEVFDKDFSGRTPDINLLKFFDEQNDKGKALTSFEQFYRSETRKNHKKGWGCQPLIGDNWEKEELSDNIKADNYPHKKTDEFRSRKISEKFTNSDIILYGKKDTSDELLTTEQSKSINESRPTFIKAKDINKYLHAIHFKGYSERQQIEIVNLLYYLLNQYYSQRSNNKNKIFWVWEDPIDLDGSHDKIFKEEFYPKLVDVYERWEICDPDLLEIWDEQNRNR